ncbi:DUF5686 and carboxypeptidase regulatory-like domain-containing protein [Flavobacterium phycosphaerae]|uniref:DUF5686 and carboxypeptidase regulatory-like domain-containing protein n=1 Tax=Flavobacterium phycosphaerae TaxID=2697515 RepID=UPI00138962E9|nr:DUF5686 and carboxypeptidase regulatory-like domain-containing protein [Flavobacterium phycosphaerae]
MLSKKTLALLCFLVTFGALAQIKGTVTDANGKPLPFVNIFEENTYNGTTTNDLGKFELNVKTPGTHKIIFQYLGFKTAKQVVEVEKAPIVVDVVMQEENITLREVVINPKDNPANEIIRNAIKNKKENSEKTARYKSDFYSRGIIRLKEAPKTIMGQKFDFFDEILDSTRSGIIYLSETVSRITFQKPDKMKEVIVASKVSGKDNGFSFNNAASVNYDFYENYLPFEVNVVSPIADNAFNYYKYKFEGSFFTENRQQINKIKVIPRRENEPVMEGYIYIVDDSYAIYATDLSIKGKQMQVPIIDNLTLKQSFSYNTNSKIWVKNTQTLDFVAGMLSIKVNGRFTYVYSNFEFETTFAKRTFTNQILSFEENANKKEDSFWNTIRPVPLTEEESTDYLKKDVLQTKKKSQKYLDSIDAKHNKFRPMDILSGYSYKNSFKKWSVNYDGPLFFPSFNTVQGWRINAGLSYFKRNEEKRSYTSISTRFDYGFSEEKIRGTFNFAHKFNNINNSLLSVNGGSMVSQFNRSNPISNIVNSVSSLFFKNNFMKLYENNFAALCFEREVVNGFHLYTNVEYSERKPLYNTTDYSVVKSDDLYSSNNPLSPNDETTAALTKHNLVKANVAMRFNFGQKYLSRPDGKYNIPNDDYPTVTLGFEKTMAATDKAYEYDFVSAKVGYDVTLGNKGYLQLNLKGGKFFNAENISFVDYRHFNGNQTHIGQGDSYTNVFNLLPYYAASTNDRFFETHMEHNDKGYIMNKLPLLKYLQSQLILGFHNLAIPDRKPYQEFSVGLDNLGFGKLKVLRVDYVRSYQNGYQGDGVIFGLKFLNVLE